jgi:arabinan endo-1,5-alpha-L-arabinosidase
LCIGVATSDSILGPYIDSGKPIIKQTTVGSIDATVFKAPDGNYLIWKDDGNGNVPKIPTWIWAVKLTTDGLGTTGEWTKLIKNDLPWEGDLVEGPWIFGFQGYYYLFYSANGYCGPGYAIGVARSKSPLGPYVKKGDPIRKTDPYFIGPGHCSVI